MDTEIYLRLVSRARRLSNQRVSTLVEAWLPSSSYMYYYYAMLDNFTQLYVLLLLRHADIFFKCRKAAVGTLRASAG